jgi:hypothetical protein
MLCMPPATKAVVAGRRDATAHLALPGLCRPGVHHEDLGVVGVVQVPGQDQIWQRPQVKQSLGAIG